MQALFSISANPNSDRSEESISLWFFISKNQDFPGNTYTTSRALGLLASLSENSNMSVVSLKQATYE